MTDQPAETPASKKGKQKTEYIVLKQLFDSNKSLDAGTYVIAGYAHGNNAAQAISDIASKTTDPDGTYVAVPVRSWQPVTITTTTETRLTLNPAN